MDKSRWSPDELMIFEQYGFRCVLCGFQYADTLHEEPPRSLNPNWKDEPWTRFPLCNAHHEAIQSMPRDEAMEMILSHVDIFFEGAIERIRNNATVTRLSTT